MKNTKQLLMIYIRNHIYTYRISHLLSQETMSEILHISNRSYIDQEHCKYGFSLMSFLYYIILLSDDEIISIISELKTLLQEDYNIG